MKQLIRFAILATLSIMVFSGQFVAGTMAAFEGPADNPGPEAYFQFRIDEATPGRILFSDLSLYHPSQWRWHFGDGFSSQEDDTEHTYAESGVFLACLIVSNSCGSDTSCDTISISSLTGVQDQRVAVPEVQLFPNPAKSFVNLVSNSRLIDPVSLLDQNGQLLRRLHPELAGSKSVRLQLPGLSPGLYLLSGRTEQGHFVERLMVD